MEIMKINGKNSNSSNLGKALNIAFHIVRGDNVCPLENNYLYEKHPWIYIQAWSMRVEEGIRGAGTMEDDITKFVDSGVFNISRETMLEALGISA